MAGIPHRFTAGYALTNGVETIVFTCPANTRADLEGIWIASTTGSAGAARVAWYDSSAATSFALIHNGAFAANDALVLDVSTLVLEDADEIRVTGQNGYHITIVGWQMTRQG